MNSQFQVGSYRKSRCDDDHKKSLFRFIILLIVIPGVVQDALGTPPLGVSPSTLNWLSIVVGGSSTQPISLGNRGGAAITVSKASVSGAGFNISGLSLPLTLTAGKTANFKVTFAPMTAGSFTGSITITSNANNSPLTVSLSGKAVAGTPAVSLSSLSLTFAGQAVGTTSNPQTVTLKNTGSATLTISSLALTGTNVGDFAQTNTCGSSVAAGANCTISVTFKPSASGTRSASVSISDNAAGSPQTVTLSGTGASSVPSVSLSPTSLSFGNQPVAVTSGSQAVTLTNTGGATLNITALTLTGDNSSDFTETNTCGSSVAAGGKCTIAVLFTPSAIGARTAALSVTDNASGSPQSVSLSGTGTHDVILSWTASTSPGVMGYNVYRGTTAGGESSISLNSTPTVGTAYTDASVLAGATYYYVVRAVAADGVTLSAPSNETAATVPSP